MRVEVVLCEHAVGSPVRKGKNRLAAGSGFRFAERLSDELERFVPRHAFESAFAFPSFSNCRVEQSIGAVQALAELADLRADEALGHRIPVRAVDIDDAAALDRDREAARIWTIERAGSFDDRRRAARRSVAWAAGRWVRRGSHIQ